MILAGIGFKNGCPNDDVFVRAFMQELSLEENERLIDHTLECKKCHQKFELLRQLSGELAKRKGNMDEGELTAEEDKRLRDLAKKKISEIKHGRFLFFDLIPARYVAIAAVLLVVIAGFLLVSKIREREIYRQGGRKAEISLIKPSGFVSKPPVIFSWTAYEGADDYWFELIDDDLNTLYSISANENQLTLPVEIRQKLEIGKTYVWKVTARDEFENVLSSDFTSFELK